VPLLTRARPFSRLLPFPFPRKIARISAEYKLKLPIKMIHYRELEARREEDDAELNLVRRGWCLGDETFRQELLAQMREPIGAEHYGEERAQTVEATAEQIIAAELKRRRWKEAALRTRPKGDPAKVALAARLRAETTMTVGWIAERLGMGSRDYLNYLLYRQRKSGRK
jgi:hypothetical protein